MSARDWAMLITLSLLWGGSFFFGEVALRDFQPFSIAFARVSIAAAVLICVHWLGPHVFPRDPRILRDLFIMGALNNAVPFSLILWGQTEITGALASILNATMPLFTILLASALTSDERITAPRLLGMLLGLAGVSVMLGAEALGELGAQVWAQLAILAAAFSYACAAVFGRRFRGLPTLTIATGQTIGSSLLMLPLLLLSAQSWQAPGLASGSVFALLGLGVLSTAVAYLLYFRILAGAGATNLSLVTFLVPVGAIGLGWTILGERLTGDQIAGMCLIALGLVAIDGRFAGYLRARLGAVSRSRARLR